MASAHRPDIRKMVIYSLLYKLEKSRKIESKNH